MASAVWSRQSREGASRAHVEVDAIGPDVEEDPELDVERPCRCPDAGHVGDGGLELVGDLEDPVGVAAQQSGHGHRGVPLQLHVQALDARRAARVLGIGDQVVRAVRVDGLEPVGTASQRDDAGVEQGQRGRALVGVARGEDLAEGPEALQQLADVGILVEQPLLVGEGQLRGQLETGAREDALEALAVVDQAAALGRLRVRARIAQHLRRDLVRRPRRAGPR